MNIGHLTRETTVRMIRGHMDKHMNEIENAYCNTGYELSIGLTVKYKRSKQSGVDVDVSINFVAERIKETSTATVDEQQKPLPFPDAKKISDKKIQLDKHTTMELRE